MTSLSAVLLGLLVQVGFTLLTSGLVRKKNAAHLVMLTFSAYVFAFLAYYAVGHALQSGLHGFLLRGIPIDSRLMLDIALMLVAGYVLVGAVYHLYDARVTGGAIYPDRARMDFTLEDLSRDRLAAIEAETNRVIQEGRRVLVRWMSREEFERADLVRLARNLVPAELERIRVIEIEGFDAQADGGTHVANTREIGRLVITKTENKGKINRRLEIALV